MDFKKRLLLVLSAIPVIVILGFVARQVRFSTASAAPSFPKIQAQADKPIEGWVVCKDLGIGPVPGISGNRQRVRLCHQEGWVVNTYCLRPDLPVPMVGGLCTRVSEDTYNCGRGLQPLREYQIRQTPTVPPQSTDTPTPTSTQTGTPTQTLPPILTPTNTPSVTPTRPFIPYPSQTPTPAYRPSPGGYGFRQLLRLALDRLTSFTAVSQASLPSPTPFRPLHPTLTTQPGPVVDQSLSYIRVLPPEPNNQYKPPSLFNIFSFKLAPGQSRVHIRIKPDGTRVNDGRSIQIAFDAGSECRFGDGNACVNIYQDSNGAEVSFITVHSGIGGEAQSLRHALEGTGFDQAALPLSQVQKNLQRLLGSEVVIKQDDMEQSGLEIAAATRLPANLVRDYINAPVNEALTVAAQVDSDLLPFVNSGQPLIIVETCGWRMPGEPNPDGLPDTSASIYLIVIKPKS